MTLADLTVGCECGGSDGTSGLAGNPAVGAFFDLLVDAGGRAIFEETAEMIGLRDHAIAPPRTPKRGNNSPPLTTKPNGYCRSVRQWSVSPGNFAGGLTTIEEKSLGAFAKAAHVRFKVSSKSPSSRAGRGLWILDSVPDEHFMQFGYTNPNDTEGLMDLISRVADCFVRDRSRQRHRQSRSRRSSKSPATARRSAMNEDMDFDAGRVLVR